MFGCWMPTSAILLLYMNLCQGLVLNSAEILGCKRYEVVEAVPCTMELVLRTGTAIRSSSIGTQRTGRSFMRSNRNVV